MNDFTKCVMKVPIFKNLKADEIDEIMSLVNHRKFKKGEYLYSQDEYINSLYVIHEGKVKITRYSEDGKEKVIRILSSGDFLGEHALFSEQKANTYAEVLEPSAICLIDSREIKEKLVKKPAIMFKMMDEIATRLSKTEAMLEYTTTNSAIAKVARLLFELERNGFVKLETTKVNLASQIGIASETFSRKLKELEDKEIIKNINNKTIEIININKLEDILYKQN